MAKNTITAADVLSEQWLRFRISLRMNDRIYGGIPKHPDAIYAFAKRSLPEAAPDVGDVAEDHADAVDADEEAELGYTVFRKNDDHGLYIEGRQAKAMMKECANILKKRLNLTAAKARVAERFFVEEPEIYLMRDGSYVTEPDGQLVGAIHVTTRQGPRTAIKKQDYVANADLTFTVKALNEPMETKDKKKIHPEDMLKIILDYGQDIGLGKDRSQGGGTFQVTTIAAIP